ncbi:MAG: oxyanion-translocating ATPase [Actinomycetia bacterium]|nr:oxyanion-translocating ATPase [Actinomycetes bacterium]
MELERFCSTSRVVIVAGKGGVGKTTVTATMALAASRAGRSVLVLEIEGKSGLAAAFGKPPLTYEESDLAPGIRGRTLTADQALLDYLRDHGLRRISKRLVSSGALDVVATAVPGMQDILVLGKVKQLERAGVADLLIVDAPAAGHAISFLLSARGLLDAVRVGPIRKQAQEVVELLTDPERCQVLLVTLPEETPVNELVETAFSIEDLAGVALGPVVVNAMYQADPFDPPLTPDRVLADATAAERFVGDIEAADLAAAATFRDSRAEIQIAQVRRLAERLPLPQIQLPYLFTADIGPAEIDTLTGAFERGVGALPALTAR